MTTWKPKGAPPELSITEWWENRTGQRQIKPEDCGHLVKDAAGKKTLAVLGKPTPSEKVRSSLADRKHAERQKRGIARQRGEKVGRRRGFGALVVKPVEHSGHVAVGRKQGAR
jgi:hypothetical protein